MGSANSTKSILLNNVTAWVEAQRITSNYGSPYYKPKKENGSKPQLDSADMLVICSWYLKSRDPIYNKCPP